MQLCHPDVVNEFPPLRVAKTVASRRLPVQLTSFVGRDAELTQLQELLAQNRLVTLTGAGGAGKTRLAIQIAAQLAGEFGDGVWYVDLAPITDPDLVPVTVARALGLPDQPGRSTMDTLTRFVADRQMLVVLDNCEHLLDASAALVVALLGGVPAADAVGHQPRADRRGRRSELAGAVAVAGRRSHRTVHRPGPPRSARLRRHRRQRRGGGRNLPRLDGLPLAIELAAARVRALSLAEILDSLHDRFRLLTGGARTAVRRQQTLRASVDWSHALLTEPERVLFRRLAAFMGGFDLDAAQAVAGGGEVERYQVLDQLTLLVDKSLVVADDSRGRTRYRLLETVRQYAQEKLGESGEADAVRSRHRDHYTSMAAAARRAGRHVIMSSVIEQAEIEIDNLRAAFAWSRENSDIELALTLASSLQPLWLARGRLREGLAWFDAALADLDAQHPEVAAAVRARALADKAVLDTMGGGADSVDQAEQALAIAREVDDPALLARTLTAYGFIASLGHHVEVARAYFAEAIGLARAADDRWRLSQILARQAQGADIAGDPLGVRAAGRGRTRPRRRDRRRVQLAECRFYLGGRSWRRAIWPEPPHSSARWPPRLRRLTMRSGGSEPRWSEHGTRTPGRAAAARPHGGRGDP